MSKPDWPGRRYSTSICAARPRCAWTSRSDWAGTSVTAAQGPVSAVVVGTGLIGTSIALALRERGCEVWLTDIDRSAARLAAELGAGEVLPAAGPDVGERGTPADVAVLAVPPAAVARVLADAQRQRLARCYTDVASVKQLPLRQARQLGCDTTLFVPSHPMS